MIRTLLVALVATVLIAPPAHATTPDIAGTWKTASLTQNRIGYELRLTPAGSADNAFNGLLQFRHRDGRKTTSTKVGLAVGKATKGSYRVTIVMPGGALATGKGTLRGRLSRTDGSMYFPKCSAVWPLAMKGEEDTDCLFRQMPG
jgi:hypothetical protein